MSNHRKEKRRRKRCTNQRLEIVDAFDSFLDVSRMYVMLNLPTSLDGLLVLLRSQICFTRELLSSRWISFSGKVVEYEGVDITIGQIVSKAGTCERKASLICALETTDQKQLIVFSTCVILGEIPS